MTPSSLAALRILMAVAAYRRTYGATATQNLLEICASRAHISLTLICGVEGCDRQRAAGRVYCKKHQLRYARHGDPTIVCRPGRKKR